jgi:hypothetical protein
MGNLNKAPNKQLVCAPTVLGRLHFVRSSLRCTAPQQKRCMAELNLVNLWK